MGAGRIFSRTADQHKSLPTIIIVTISWGCGDDWGFTGLPPSKRMAGKIREQPVDFQRSPISKMGEYFSGMLLRLRSFPLITRQVSLSPGLGSFSGWSEATGAKYLGAHGPPDSPAISPAEAETHRLCGPAWLSGDCCGAEWQPEGPTNSLLHWPPHFGKVSGA